MNRLRTIAKRIPKFLLLAIPLSLLLSLPTPTSAAEFTYQNLEDQHVTIKTWPAFIITSQSEADLKDALRCATQVSSIAPKPHWLIDFAWPQSTTVKRRVAKRLLKSAFMKAHSTILENSPSHNSIIVLINNENTVLWNSESYPSDDDWKIALDIIDASRAE